MLQRVANAVLFQIGWLTCVLGGNSRRLLVALAVLVIHLCWISSWAAEGGLILSVVIVGTAVDSVLRGAGVFAFQDQSPLIPLWLMLLWALLATKTLVKPATSATGSLSLAFGIRGELCRECPPWLLSS